MIISEINLGRHLAPEHLLSDQMDWVLLHPLMPLHLRFANARGPECTVIHS